MKLLIYGGGGLAKETYDLIMRNEPDRWEKIYFIDDFADEGPCYLSESIRFDSIKTMFGNNMDDVEAVIGIGEPKYREMLSQKLEDVGIKLVSIIDKTALISPTAKIGVGSVVCEYVTIHADVEIGKSVLIQPFSDIGHDVKIGDYSVMGPHCAPGGGVLFGKRVYTGLHAVIKERLTVGDDCIIGMGAVVYKDIEPMITVIGNPARPTKNNDNNLIFVTKTH